MTGKWFVDSTIPGDKELLERLQNARGPEDLMDLYDKNSLQAAASVKNDILYHRRSYFVNEVKAPLMKVIESLGSGISLIRSIPALIKACRLINKFPLPRPGESMSLNTQATLEIITLFNRYHDNPGRQPLFDALYRLIVPEFEHDGYYSTIRDWWIEEIIIAILHGEWQPRPEGWLLSKWWKEPAPYGGKYSIVAKLIKHRAEILKLIEEE